MTTNAEEETIPPENAKNSMDWMAQLGERGTSYPQVVSSNPTPVEVFGFRLLTLARRNSHLWIHIQVNYYINTLINYVPRRYTGIKETPMMKKMALKS